MTAQTPPPSLPHRLLPALLWLGVIAAGGYHLAIQGLGLRLPEPMGSWETVYAAVAQAWPDQYQWSHYTDGHDGYGPGYPAFVRPFLLLGLDVYVAHRLANLAALLAACAWLGRLLRGAGASLRVTAAVVTIFYALNAGSYSIQARPDFLVLLEITAILALGAAAARGRVTLGWRFGLGLGLLVLAAVLTKAYAAFSWAAVLAYLAVFVDWRRTLVTAAVSGAVLAAGIALFAWHNPLYELSVFRGQVVQADPSLKWLGVQLGHFSLLAAGLLAVVAVTLLRRREPAATADHISRGSPAHYWNWQALLAAIGLLAGPGWHTGAYLTYFLHLLLVPLAVVAGRSATMAGPGALHWPEIALTANLAILLAVAPGLPRPDPGWTQLRQDILQEQGRVAVDYLLEPVARERAGTLLVSTGLTSYTLRAPFVMTGDAPTVVRARATARQFIADQTRALFGESPADVLYLDCLFLPPPGGGPGPLTIVPRNELPYFSGAEMHRYAPTKTYHVYPYYFSTNAPRQRAGLEKCTVVRFVRKK
jgi:hypothetical protein